VARQQNVSEETARKIDHEVRRLVDEGYEEARRVLTEHKDELEILAQGLLEFETLTGEEIKDLLKGKRPIREDPSEDSQPPRTSPVPTTGTKPRPSKGGDPGLEPQPQA
jgi:cell division protease FtsH